MLKKKIKISPKSWIEISKSALLNNLRVFRKTVGKNVKIAAVIKANAYGHGTIDVAKILNSKPDVSFFAVDNLEEALLLRLEHIEKPILVLGFTPSQSLEIAVKNNISLTIYDLHHLKEIIKSNLSQRARIHLKIETGMNRQGILTKDLSSFSRFIKRYPKKISLEGISTHFASADDTHDKKLFLKQLGKFKEAIKILESEGINTESLLIHCAASSATFIDNKTHFNMIRMGISLYGLWPSENVKRLFLSKNRGINLKPVLSWKSVIAQIKVIEKGDSVGYSATWKAQERTKIAVIPVGYSDGFDRGFSNNGNILISGKFVPIIGRVAMNMFMTDVSTISGIKEGDEVILIGRSGANNLSADTLAEKIDTINYEIVARINPLLPRKII